MRRDWSHLFPLISILLLFSALSYGQAWSGILASSRAINWGNAGLPATLPDGETTPNPWTPPTRTQCGSTVNPSGLTNGTDVTNIDNALAACAAGHYVLLGPGTFNIENADNCFGGGYSCIQMYAQNGVTLRGSGAQSTKLILTGASLVSFGLASGGGSASWTAGYSQRATALTYSGSGLTAGQIIFLTQCDSGYSGSPCAGTTADNGGLYICGGQSACDSDGVGPGNSNHNQVQVVYVTNVSGSTVTFTPGLYMPNWSSANSPTISWNATTPYGNGLEDLTVDATAATYNDAILLSNTYASWVKGVRMIGYAAGDAISIASTKSCLVFNNYLFADAITVGSDMVFSQTGTTSDLLYLNNIVTGGQTWNGLGSNEDIVVAYNYGRDSQTSYVQLAMYDHVPGSAFEMLEANESGLFLGDNTWGTTDLGTLFRNYLVGTDPTYTTAPLPRVSTLANYARFENFVGNVLGGSQITTYQATSGNNYVYLFGSDSLTPASALRWGNFDNVTNAVRWCGNSSDPGWTTTCSSTSEIPTSLSGNAAPFENTVPTTTSLPCSFFLAGYTSTTCTPHASGGTGLSWWKVCTAWTTFPTSCSTTQLQPFPPIGPDVTGGTYASGFAYDIPASIAFKNLPIDTSYQNSYSITNSSWSSGTETLTVSGLKSGSSHIMGSFQVTGACSSGAGEYYMTSSSSTAGTISYALASNPGSCSGGAVKFPDVRQFDERVYQNDPSGNPPLAPTGLQATVQ